MKITAIIVAGGKGTRMGADKNKLLLKIKDKEILYFTLAAFERNKNIDDIVLVSGESDVGECERIIKDCGITKVRHITVGGLSRQQSVMNGLKCAQGDIVLIHDGARALVTGAEIDASIADCVKYGAAAVGVKCKDTLKSSKDGFISGTVDRELTYLIQTPQVFYLDKILALHQKAACEGFEATDDCMIAEHYGVRVRISQGSYDNIKITTPDDIIIAEKILEKREK
ncbi:MAG: 2-C-methyl-D-erythritol 4-phosphate cytidylyltransferase [Oscillospiraceae bacterium]|nr:2-C-methyl-D-erythritol 4-phosphate cytidylyltransferase [Oscillospiraceae bacterium]